MPNDLTPPDPTRFGLASFADLLPAREHIVGEDLGSFDGFHDGMMRSLAPITPYECVIAENLIAIEWEIVQHRRMRDVGLRQNIREAIQSAVINRQEYLHETEMETAWEKHVAKGGDEDDWEDPFDFDEDAAGVEGEDLAKRTVSQDLNTREQAYAEIRELGLEPVELMGEAYRSYESPITNHEKKLPELERRRREVKRDFDMLQRARPLEAEVIEG